MFYIVHEDSFTMAARVPEGESMSPKFKTDDIEQAARFNTFGAASDASQNFGPDWWVEEIG